MLIGRPFFFRIELEEAQEARHSQEDVAQQLSQLDKLRSQLLQAEEQIVKLGMEKEEACARAQELEQLQAQLLVTEEQLAERQLLKEAVTERESQLQLLQSELLSVQEQLEEQQKEVSERDQQLLQVQNQFQAAEEQLLRTQQQAQLKVDHLTSEEATETGEQLQQARIQLQAAEEQLVKLQLARDEASELRQQELQDKLLATEEQLAEKALAYEEVKEKVEQLQELLRASEERYSETDSLTDLEELREKLAATERKVLDQQQLVSERNVEIERKQEELEDVKAKLALAEEQLLTEENSASERRELQQLVEKMTAEEQLREKEKDEIDLKLRAAEEQYKACMSDREEIEQLRKKLTWTEEQLQQQREEEEASRHHLLAKLAKAGHAAGAAALQDEVTALRAQLTAEQLRAEELRAQLANIEEEKAKTGEQNRHREALALLSATLTNMEESFLLMGEATNRNLMCSDGMDMTNVFNDTTAAEGGGENTVPVSLDFIAEMKAKLVMLQSQLGSLDEYEQVKAEVRLLREENRQLAAAAAASQQVGWFFVQFSVTKSGVSTADTTEFVGIGSGCRIPVAEGSIYKKKGKFLIFFSCRRH
jgi:chromosome segregation ATPase